MSIEVLLQDYIDFHPGWWAMTGGFHQHPVDELIFLSKGAAVSTCLGRIIKVRAPAVIFYPHSSEHNQRNDESLPYLRHAVRYLPGDLDGCVPFDSLPRDFFGVSLTQAEFARLSPYLPLLLEAEPAETRQVRRRHLLAIVLAELAPILAAHAAEVEPKQHPNDILLTALCKEIGKHVSEPISLDELARRHFISRAKLDRLFVDALGMPPGRYLLNIRLSRACIDLRAGLSVQETAARCGYTNVGHFIRLFRRYTGVTPAKFRRGE